jgi:hypothetical protein
MNLAVFPSGFFSFSSGWQGEWFMLKERVWRQSQRKGKRRFLCVGCTECRIDRKLTVDDFSRSAKVNFTRKSSRRLRHRIRGLKPAKRLVNTTFTP